MKWTTRLFCLSVIGLVWAADAIVDLHANLPHEAVAALNGGGGAQQRLQADEFVRNTMLSMASWLTILALFVLALSYFPDRWRIALSRKSLGMAGGCTLLAMSSLGCMRSYDTPEYAEVDTAETAFVVPLEGDSADQAKFQSEQFLEQHKVAAKRVQIVHRWNQTGRMIGDGQWIPMVRLIKVNRSPITREWTAEEKNGTSKADQAVWIESADSVGFSIGFTVTSHITEENAAKFLYWYPAGSLADVMDHEVRGRVQQSAAEVAAKYPLDELRGRKQEMVDAVRKDVTAFFAERGITITTVGMFGGMTYENPKIQQAIDEVFIAQQLKDVALAKFEAQAKTNEQIALEAEGIAKKTQTAATAEAQAKVTAAEADAKSIQTINAALASAGPQLIALRQLEIDKARVEKWNGTYPTFYLGDGGSTEKPNLMIQMPAVAAK